jgi:hypothetical protein
MRVIIAYAETHGAILSRINCDIFLNVNWFQNELAIMISCYNPKL